MVSREIIDEVFKKVLTVKHDTYEQRVREVLREITDTKEEYNTLRKVIIDFRKEHNLSKIEYAQLQDNKGNTYSVKGKKHRVSLDDSIVEKGGKEGLLYFIHNHPNGYSFQSYNDFDLIRRLNIKYNITIGHGTGIMIIKNNNGVIELKNDNDSLLINSHRAYNEYRDDKMKNMLKDCDESIQKLNERFFNNEISKKELSKGFDDITMDYLKKNIKNYGNVLQEKCDDYNLNYTVRIIKNSMSEKINWEKV